MSAKPQSEKSQWFKCDKCGSVFNEIGGKRYRNGDVDQWCPECGASDDLIFEVQEYSLPIGLYSEALETYEGYRPAKLNKRYATYYLTEEAWRHLAHMAECHLIVQADPSAVDDENGHCAKCRRYLKQLRELCKPSPESK